MHDLKYFSWSINRQHINILNFLWVAIYLSLLYTTHLHVTSLLSSIYNRNVFIEGVRDWQTVLSNEKPTQYCTPFHNHCLFHLLMDLKIFIIYN